MKAAKATVCDLLTRPEVFNGMIVSVRAVVDIGFEEFAIVDAKCSSELIDTIWLEYAKGPKSQPTVWCCGDLTPHDSLGVVQDEEFRKFDRYLRAIQNGTPKYIVTATITGRFEAVPVALCPDKRHECPVSGGFGHMGLAPARLVIHSVSDSTVRTR